MRAHPTMTNRFPERVERVRIILSPRTDDLWRRRMLDENGITLVVWTEASGSKGAVNDLETSPLFEPVLILPRARVFRVRRTAVHLH